ncbi:hypothetical protein [Aurantiacibacter hainanensis]|uniref:hypothetical protein n=1 Tax=Aurantiacibacter hainanensis TaxID=3076114 RepID=UPI0030C74E83
MKATFKILAAAVLLASVPASAGEYGGNGQYVPGGDRGASDCSYSGLNDDDDGQGFTQTFAAFLRFLGIDAGRYFNAGMFCKGK